jgi:Putative auto-transporter adhesin, head GIN domain
MKARVLVVLLACGACWACWGCGWTGVEGSGNATSQVRQVTGFDAIEVAGAVNIDVALSPHERVEISGDDNLVPLITTELVGKHLKIDTRKNVRPKLPLIAHITAPRISAIEVSGSSRVTLHGIREDSLTIDVSGSGTIRGDGAVSNLSISLSGSSNVELMQLPAQIATISITGSGNVDVSASRTLAVNITGSGNVRYSGNPENVTQAITGSGRVVKR